METDSEDAPVYTDEEFGKLIKETVFKDSVKDAAIDILIYKLKNAFPSLQWSKGYFNVMHQSEQDFFDRLPPPVKQTYLTLRMELCSTINSKLSLLESPGPEDVEGPKQRLALWPRMSRRMAYFGVRVIMANQAKTCQDSFLAKASEDLIWPPSTACEDAKGPIRTQQALLDKITSGIHGQEARATFACSGSVVIGTDRPANDNSIFPPVHIRWGPTSNGSSGHIQFPLPEEVDISCPQTSPGDPPDVTGCAPINELIHACQSATFGHGKEEVYDETYRKASKLSSADFCTSFSPYEAGIIDSVNQMLLPSLADWSSANNLGTVAELYSLNVYSAPSGHFKPHSDTPRGENHYGSLVVCLPCPHNGGGLAVRHRSTEHVFDWTNDAPSGIEWAAFYRDCEHEVLDVTRGGVLGVFCSHKYPHLQKDADQRLPASLKGIDLALHSALLALRLEVKVAPILGQRRSFVGLDERTPLKQKDTRARWDFDSFQDSGRHYKRSGRRYSDLSDLQTNQLQLQYEGDMFEDGDSDADERRSCAFAKASCRNQNSGYYVEGDFESQRQRLMSRRIKGIDAHGEHADIVVGQWSSVMIDGTDFSEDDQGPNIPHWHLSNVIWLNRPPPGSLQLQAVHGAYGNQPSLEYVESAAVQLIIVPAFQERDKTLKEGTEPPPNTTFFS